MRAAAARATRTARNSALLLLLRTARTAAAVDGGGAAAAAATRRRTLCRSSSTGSGGRGSSHPPLRHSSSSRNSSNVKPPSPSPSPLRSVPLARLQEGAGTVVASAMVGTGDGTTRLTTVAHRAPVRLIPQRPVVLLRDGRTAANGGGNDNTMAVVTVAHYGGGLAAGDAARLRVVVEDGACLLVNTQGASRIYKQRRQRQRPRRPDSGGDGGGVQQEQEQQQQEQPSAQTLAAAIGRDALLVSVPDFVTLQADSVFEQRSHYTLACPATSSLAAVDWISAGRVARGERWQQRSARTAAQVRLLRNNNNRAPNNSNNNNHHDDGDEPPAVVWADAQSSPCDADVGGCAWNCYATVVLCGPQTVAMVARFQTMQRALCEPHAAVRTAAAAVTASSTNNSSSSAADRDDTTTTTQAAQAVCDQLAGRVLLGVSRSDVAVADAADDGDHNNTNNANTTNTTTTTTTSIHTVRLAAQSNEDVYRLLHFGIGLQVYRERIAASRSARILPSGSTADAALVHDDNDRRAQRMAVTQRREQRTSSSAAAAAPPVEFFSKKPSSSSSDNNSDWAAYMLADSALPTGSFAHSAGLEAASQLGLLRDAAAVDAWVAAAARSAVTLSAPLVWAGHCVLATAATTATPTPSAWLDEWCRLDRYAHALLSTNAPACRASLDQGWSLLRLAVQLQQQQQQPSTAPGHALETPLLLLQQKLQATTPTSGAAGHWATLLGAVAQQLQLSQDQACRLLAYNVARDAVSSAVRLNLLGPAAGQVALQRAQATAAEALQLVERRLMVREETDRMRKKEGGDNAVDPVGAAVAVACGCAPVLEAVHPCHDVLATRLFRT